MKFEKTVQDKSLMTKQDKQSKAWNIKCSWKKFKKLQIKKNLKKNLSVILWKVIFKATVQDQSLETSASRQRKALKLKFAWKNSENLQL